MTSVARALPVSGLSDLSNESRMISAPWSRMIRGIGLGQYPIEFAPAVAGHIRRTFDQLAAKVSPSNAYTLFCRDLTDFVLTVADPARQDDVAPAVGPLLQAARAERNPYYRAMAGSLVMDSFAKLGLDVSLLVNDERDFPAEVLGMLDEIAPDQIADENQGRHGDYERLSASSTVFLAIGQLGLKDRLVTPDRNHVIEGLNLLENIPAPYFRGRAGAMFLSVVTLLGFDEYIFDGERDYMKEVLHYMTRADELKIYPSFPQELPVAWAKVYPLLTMLNAIAMSGRTEYLNDPIDWLAEAKVLLEQVPWDDRVHMSQYYIVALHNLGRLQEELPDLDGYLAQVAAVLDLVDPGGNFFPNGIAYPYIIEVAMITGRMHLIPDEALTRMVDAFPGYDRTEADHANSAFPVSYVLNVLGEIDAADLIFEPRAQYGGSSALAWVVDHMSEGAKEEGTRLYMINHALVSYALRMRGAGAPETELFRNFRFAAA
ncbi:hypothetical protein [Amycolatopsis pithecellobii]|uniref:Uncharacterized protein n=1 Tax=Amycolatopsis pithecellobii TaxID=664692 RepID=A0A6N7Z5F1_9PSEU|nr:hypothetical protein [Amycolatopsis pithecellobii]MTD55804.1 hypothetical protein [Amycolatopsis pithecellobii]